MNTYFDTVFCDSDGVLFNFHLEAVRAHLRVGRRIQGLHHHGTPLELTNYALMKQYPRGVSLSKWLCPDIQEHADYWSPEYQRLFWKPIEQDPFFWRNMPTFEHSENLLKMLKGYCKHLVMLTTPHTDPNCYYGKYFSLRRSGLAKYFTEEPIFCKHKWRLAHPSCLLIDDFSQHTQSWVSECQRRYERDGSAILFPAMWNENHEYTNDPVGFVDREIQVILDGWLPQHFTRENYQ
jgi:hypothetical protein